MVLVREAIYLNEFGVALSMNQFSLLLPKQRFTTSNLVISIPVTGRFITIDDISYWGKKFFVEFVSANILAGLANGGYSWLTNIFNKEGSFFGL